MVLVANGVFKVFSQNRVQQRRLLLWNAFLSGLWSNSLTFLLLVEAFDRILPHLLVLRMRILLGVFARFPKLQKKCEVGSAPESEGARQCQPIHAGGSARIGLVVGVTHSCSAGRVGGGQGGSEEGAREQEEAEEEEEKEDEAVTFLIGCLVLPEEYFQYSAWFDSGYLHIRPSTVVFSSPCI